MAQSACTRCGAGLFLGEGKCPSCGAPAPEEVASFGHDVDRGSHGPPPEGLSLIVQKGLTDAEIRDRHLEDDRRYGDSEAGIVFGASAGLASMAKVERDGDGKVVWDPKHAIIGAIVVAIFVALLAGYFYMRVRFAMSGYSPTTTIR